MYQSNHYLKIIAFIFLTIQPSFAGTLDFIKRGLAHCTGYCESNHINCNKYVDKQGYYTWCQKNCTHESKTNLETFTKAIELCDKNKFQCKISELNKKDNRKQGYHVAVCANEIIRISLSNASPEIKNLNTGDMIYLNEIQTIDESTEQQRKEYYQQLKGGYRPDGELPTYKYAKGKITKG